jgi:16S rRNA (cytosine967-C5)-methyltransferase
MTARQVAFDTLKRIEMQGAFANLVLDAELKRSDLDAQDRRFATQLVYGTTRMRRACDFLIDRFVLRDVDPPVRTLLRLGAYQLHYLSTPDHAAVDATVSLAPKKVRGFVNAILRKVARADVEWPSDAMRLSYPDWLVQQLIADLGEPDAIAMLERMNVEPSVHVRSDGYVQDPASQWVCEAVNAQAGELVLDSCAAPGGKATLMAASGATIIAADRRINRIRLVASNAERTQAANVHAVVADGSAPPYRTASFDRVLVDAPCSGLGVLRRRADARWRIDAEAIERLSRLQAKLLAAGAESVKPGGRLVYSVCTLTHAETTAIAATLGDGFESIAVVDSNDVWRRWGDNGACVFPQDRDSDGMAVFAWQRIR